jgi:hypothetical protein
LVAFVVAVTLLADVKTVAVVVCFCFLL